MEQNRIWLSALSAGVGVGVGLGLASSPSVSKRSGRTSEDDGITGEQIEQELMRHVVDGKLIKVTFDDFPYYLSERTRVLLTSAAYVQLKNNDVSRHTRNLSPVSRAILLSGPAELYQQMLAKALAHYFESKLLLLDITDFSLKMQNKYGCTKKEPAPSLRRSISEMTLEGMNNLFGSLPLLSPREETSGTSLQQGSGIDLKPRPMEGPSSLPKHRRNASAASDISSVSSNRALVNSAPHERTSSWCFDQKLFLQSLYRVLVSVSETGSIILYLRDVENLILGSQNLYNLFQKLLNKLSGPVLILGSRMLDPGGDYKEVDDRLSVLFPYNIEIKPPEDETRLGSWKAKLEEDMKMLRIQDNRNHIAEVLAANDLECDDIGSISPTDTVVLSNYIQEIVVSAISYHLKNKDPEYRNGKLVISSKSLSHGLSLFQEGKSCRKDTLKLGTNAEPAKDEVVVRAKTKPKSDTPASESKIETEKSNLTLKKDVEKPPAPKVTEAPPDNEFEKRIRPEVIPANEIGVTFADIGALDETKESLQELVMLPLRRPDLFNGGLLKPCRGILLFGPPGTGKTMLAKAIASEAGASFINVSMSTITSKWFGEDEKNVRALFTLAAKVSPTIIFVDEVDSMLGQRTRVGEHEAMRKIKNEFMAHWDGLLTKAGERILVLAATNRPFDLDEAIIRRFERRIMVGLPSIESREKILRTLLAKEKAEDLDYKELATMTEGYSGSDLKNLCVTAAYRPVRELMQHERSKDLKKRRREEAGQSSEDALETKVVNKDGVITLRPLNMEDMREAKNQVAASFASEGSVMSELKQWNELYGEGGSRKKQELTYFL
ncbi:hypothetical protein like AT4G28000 [Hibiscus trionum]|uniref:AAA+ ATPase domain-containing protein n=1 Tax=Hibiscus trionum TaxID=183268 RepID=A0A9W7JFI2_HIBTR|nr:hypothetical protein like AT4G28000 [Hibiscus trionum]